MNCTSVHIWRVDVRVQDVSTAKILNLLFAGAEQKGETLKFRVYIGLESDCSSADKLSFDLKFNRWDIAVTLRLERHSTSKTVTQYDHLDLGAQSRTTCGSMMSRRFVIDQYAV